MATTFTAGNPIISAGTGAGTITADYVKVRAVRWVGGTTTAHAAVLTDTAGNVVWKSALNTVNLGTDQESLVSFACLGLKVLTLDSGVLYLYF